jgi:hypothetical protein
MSNNTRQKHLTARQQHKAHQRSMAAAQRRADRRGNAADAAWAQAELAFGLIDPVPDRPRADTEAEAEVPDNVVPFADLVMHRRVKAVQR